MSILNFNTKKAKAEKGCTVIVGCGRLGANIADSLSEEGKDVIIIDSNSDSFRKLSPMFGGMKITGDATELLAFDDIDFKDVSSVIAVTNHDNTNIMVAQMAKEILHIDKVIARLYDPARECVYRELGIDTICPVILSTNEVDNLLFGGTDA